MSYLKLSEIREDHEKIDETLTIPVPASLKERYKKASKALQNKNAKRIHSLLRPRISKLLDELEELLNEPA